MMFSNSVKSGFVAFVLYMVPLSASVQGRQDPVVLDEIVAKVNHEIITRTDLEQELRTLRMGLAEQIQDPERLEEEFERQKSNLLRTMIENKLMLQRAEELGLGANIDVEVNAYIEELRRENNLPSLEVLDQILRQRGSNLNEFRSNIRQQMIKEALVGQMVYSKLTILTPEIEAYYEENRDRFTEPAQVELAEVLVLKEGRDPAEVRSRAEEALSRLEGGADFAEVAREYSDGPSASRGGDIGSFRQGTLAAPLEEAVFKLEPGEHSGIVETDYGLQILNVLSTEEPKRRPLDEVRQEIQRTLYAKKAEPELEAFLENLRAQSYVYVAPKYREEFAVEGL